MGQRFLVLPVVLFFVLGSSFDRRAFALDFGELAKLQNPGSPTTGIFGNALALSSDGSTAVVAAPVVSNPSGSSYVFVRPSGGWAAAPNPAATLRDPALASGTIFGLGAGISIDGSVIAIAEGNPNRSGGDELLLFERPAGGWSGDPAPAARLAASQTVSEFFALTVAMSDDTSTIAIGQPAVGSSAGATLVYTRPANGWTDTVAPSAMLENTSGQANDYLGLSVVMSADGSLVCVGSPGIDSNKAPKVRGFAFVFVRPPGGWSGTLDPSATLTDPAGAPGDFFGFAVAMSSDGALIAASGAYQQPPGKLFVFARPSEGWAGSSSPSATLIPSTASTASEIFVSAAISRDGSRILGGRLQAANGGTAGVIDAFAEPAAGWKGTVLPAASVSSPSATLKQGFGYPLSMDGAGKTFLTGDFLAALQGNKTDNAVADVFLFEEIQPPRSGAAAIVASALARCRGR